MNPYMNIFWLLHIPHLYQSLLHGSPIGNPPSTLKHEIRVRVAFGLAVFCQRLPLVQFLRTAGHEDKGGETFSLTWIVFLTVLQLS